MVVQVAAIARETPVVHHVADAGLVRIEASEQAGPGRTAAAGVIELGEAEPGSSEPIKLRRLDLAAIAADVGVAHVIGEDHHDVGPVSDCWEREQAQDAEDSCSDATVSQPRVRSWR